ncbi:MAG: hypothetical protein KBT05_03780, partial [Bacteroidales bacterium]|nr:hypothetical protein [Candidatus Cryptobacteroides caccocaballi]
MNRNRFLLVAAFVLFACGSADAQNILGRLAERAKNAAENAVGNKIENAVNNAVDKVGKKGKNDNAGEVASEAETTSASTADATATWTCPECGKAGNTGAFCDDCGAKKPGAGSAVAVEPAEAAGEQAKSDFVPGAVTLFEDKVTGEQVGEFPSKWNLMEGNCEVSKLGGETVISLPPATTQDEYVDSQIQPLMKEIYNYLPEEYTIEF